ncbi:hypothetical protein BurJ1DRAFT_3210 [Burkholderiales bacterium JOSHI_001]|nr:hypothetical protein BurJ1DRAFT_3210 [Burkholderiales bacterium JOSHI_001]
MRLQLREATGGSAGAQLCPKNKTTGAVTLVAQVGAKLPKAVVQNYAVPIPPLNFDTNADYVVITFNLQAAAQPAAHILTLTLQ